jgi:hypothetical protein
VSSKRKREFLDSTPSSRYRRHTRLAWR